MKRILLILMLAASITLPVQAGAIKYKGDLESNESVTLPEQGVTPANPAAGKKKVYVKSDGLHVLDSAGADQFLNPSQFKAGSFTRDTTLASGTQAITGVGFQPSAVIFFMGSGDNTPKSWGFTDGNSDFCIYEGASSGQIPASIVLAQGVGSYIGTIDSGLGSLDSDGFTVDWLKTSLPTLTITIQYIAWR